ncbi:MAG: hypothetical protein AABZ28_03505 [Nitrospinota bacterium]
MKKTLKIAGWSLLWLAFFWLFLIAGFPIETTKGWLTRMIEKEFKVSMSIERLRINWNLNIAIKGVSINSTRENEFTLKIGKLNIAPQWAGLIRLKPAIKYHGNTPSGGDFSGYYNSDELSLSFKEISFLDISISSILLPSTAIVNGSGRLKLTKDNGIIEIEVDGIPGGRQRLRISGGEKPGLNGKLSVAVTLPKL